jgi:hypothetical protein
MTTTLKGKNPMTDTITIRRPARRAAALLSAALFPLLAACDVTNPGPVADTYLDAANVHQALVNGAGRRLSQAISFVGYTGALSAREIIAGGQTGNGGHDPITQAGLLLSNATGTHWNNAQQSRWIAEDAIRRFAALPAGTVNQQTLAEAHLWAGYANRLLGENFCDAVFDGGPVEPNIRYFERAEMHFTEAVNLGTGTFKTAAYAGRASVRVWLKDWTGAAADAGQVPLAFTYLVNADGAAEDTRNQIYFSSSNTPYRGFSVFKTWFAGYYDQTGDPRTSYGKSASIPFANTQLSGYGPVPWWFQTKYVSVNDDFRVSSGREMVLVRAEALLTQGKWPEAMTLINSIRTTVLSQTTNKPLAPYTATSLVEAWTYLKRERGIELWLEARRLGDIRRWEQNKTPGALDWPDFESLSALFRANPPSRCFPTPDSEINSNPNI